MCVRMLSLIEREFPQYKVLVEGEIKILYIEDVMWKVIARVVGTLFVGCIGGALGNALVNALRNAFEKDDNERLAETQKKHGDEIISLRKSDINKDRKIRDLSEALARHEEKTNCELAKIASGVKTLTQFDSAAEK